MSSLANAERIPIHANHINVVKFESQANAGFKRILDRIKLMVAKASDKVDQNWVSEDKIAEGT